MLGYALACSLYLSMASAAAHRSGIEGGMRCQSCCWVERFVIEIEASI